MTRTVARGAGTRIKAVIDRLGTFSALIILIIVMTILSKSFLTSANLFNILQQISVISVIATGMTFVILLGGIDLSVGSIEAFTALFMAMLIKNQNWSPWLAILAALALGALLGWCNGFLIAKVNLPPFIATLGMMSIARGAAFTISGGAPIYSFPSQITGIASAVGPVPIPVIIMAVVFLVAAYTLNQTRLGRYTYSIGGNETASVLSGIGVVRYKEIVYIISGVCCAVAGVILTARLDSAVPVAGDGAELDAIAAVVIGGTSMSGGEGSIIGTIIGALIMGVISNGLNLLIVPQGMQRVVKGAIIIIAVIIDVSRKRKK